jgi:hemolysin activation/secretion protein
MARHIDNTQSIGTPGAARQLALACAAACAVTALGLAARAASAQTMPAASSPSPQFTIRGFKVLGDNPLSDGETSAVLAPYLRTSADIEVLQQATSALEKALRDKGFGLHRVALPPQSLSDTVTLNVVKFTMGQITVEQNKHHDAGNVRASLPELQENGTPNFRKLAIQSAIANESPSKQVTISLRESNTADKIDATLRVSDVSPWNFSVFASNSGSESSGQDRVTLSGGYANLWNLDHQAVLTYTTSVERPSAVKQIGASYRVPFYTLGGTLVASATKSDVVGNFGTFSSTGAGQTFGLNYTHHLPPDGGYRGFINLGFNDRQFDVTKINGIPSPGQLARRSRPLSIGYSARIDSDKRFWAYNLDVSTNLSGGAGNTLAAYQSEDPRVSTTKAAVVRGGVNLSMPVTIGSGEAWSFGGRMQFQWAAAPASGRYRATAARF